MNHRYTFVYTAALVLSLCIGIFAETVTLQAVKDNSGRSNDRNRNNGGNRDLYVAHAPNLRTIIAFDLTEITNRIEQAVFRFRTSSTSPKAITLTVAPMVHTEGNAAWIEGTGALGTSGQNAKTGESCYSWRAFPDHAWEASPDVPVVDLGDKKLWGSPFLSANRLNWEKGEWIDVPLKDVTLLEQIRGDSSPVLTIGLWGTAGNGLYAISARESGYAPELVLEVEIKESSGNSGPRNPLR